jgi:hypothetical protein
MKKIDDTTDMKRLEYLFGIAEERMYDLSKLSKPSIDLDKCMENAICFIQVDPTSKELSAVRSSDGFSLLHIAVNRLNPFLVAILICLGMNINSKAKGDGITPIELFKKTGHLVGGMKSAFYDAEKFLTKVGLLGCPKSDKAEEKDSSIKSIAIDEDGFKSSYEVDFECKEYLGEADDSQEVKSLSEEIDKLIILGECDS